MRKLVLAALLGIAFATPALSVSVGEIIGKCGDDSDQFCKGVGYGDPMQACLDRNYAKLSSDCKLIVDRLRAGEGVSLF